jgi:hypothetical protein
MLRRAVVLSAIGLCVAMTYSVAIAQSAPATYQGDRNVYKVIFEDQNFRVIEGFRKAGVHDKAHSHPLPYVVYNVTDCTTKLHTPDGKTTERTSKAGTAGPGPLAESHTAENVGPTDCRQIFVERSDLVTVGRVSLAVDSRDVGPGALVREKHQGRAA